MQFHRPVAAGLTGPLFGMDLIIAGARLVYCAKWCKPVMNTRKQHGQFPVTLRRQQNASVGS
jgi:hypothetical protein